MIQNRFFSISIMYGDNISNISILIFPLNIFIYIDKCVRIFIIFNMFNIFVPKFSKLFYFYI